VQENINRNLPQTHATSFTSVLDPRPQTHRPQTQTSSTHCPPLKSKILGGLISDFSPTFCIYTTSVTPCCSQHAYILQFFRKINRLITFSASSGHHVSTHPRPTLIAMTISTNRLVLEHLTAGASYDPYSMFDDDEIRGEFICEVAQFSSKALQIHVALSNRSELARKNSFSNFKSLNTRGTLLSPIVRTSPTYQFNILTGSERHQSSEILRLSDRMTRQGYGRNLPRLSSPTSGTIN
jgi:hypothetical protein